MSKHLLSGVNVVNQIEQETQQHLGIYLSSVDRLVLLSKRKSDSEQLLVVGLNLSGKYFLGLKLFKQEGSCVQVLTRLLLVLI